MRKIAMVVAASLVLASCSSGVSSPRPTPGVLSGVVIGHSSRDSHGTPLAGAVVGVYQQEVSSGGPLLQHPPQPVATTSTGSAGEFSFRGLPAGRWFVFAGQGAWVQFDPSTGAVITLAVCTDCPIPL